MRINESARADEPYYIYDPVDESHIIQINNRLDNLSRSLNLIIENISDVRSEVNPSSGDNLGERIVKIEDKLQDIDNVTFEMNKTLNGLCEYVSELNIAISNAEDRIKFLMKIPVVAFLIVLGIIVYVVLKH